MIFHENRLLADDSRELLYMYLVVFFRNIGNMSQNVLSAVVVIGAFRVKQSYDADQTNVCAGWSAPLLFAKQQNQGFSRRYPYENIRRSTSMVDCSTEDREIQVRASMVVLCCVLDQGILSLVLTIGSTQETEILLTGT